MIHILVGRTSHPNGHIICFKQGIEDLPVLTNQQTVPMAVKEKDFSDNPYLLQTSCQRMEEKHLFYCQIDWIRLTRYQTKCLNLFDVVSTNESHEIYENWQITSSHVINLPKIPTNPSKLLDSLLFIFSDIRSRSISCYIILLFPRLKVAIGCT